MRNTDWRVRFRYRCYFYPGRDCPGWDAGGICGRVGNRVPVDETGTPELGPWKATG